MKTVKKRAAGAVAAIKSLNGEDETISNGSNATTAGRFLHGLILE
jgi:hypothetical protein